MLILAKFKCSHVETHEYGGRRVILNPICADGIPEHNRFHKATPSGKLEMWIDNESVNFEPGQVYDVTFTPEPPIAADSSSQ